MDAGQVSLLLAAVDAQVINLVTTAMSATNAKTAACIARSAGANKQVSPRPVHKPQPRVAPRPVHKPQPRIEAPTFQGPPTVKRTSTEPSNPEQPRRAAESLLPPPWKMPLWKVAPQPPVSVKPIVQRPDISTKGTLLDRFI